MTDVITALARYRKTIDTEMPGAIAPRGYETMRIAWRLVIDEAGRLLALLRTDGTCRPVPALPAPRTSGTTPRLAADNASYVLGIPVKATPATARKRFESARKLHGHVLAKNDSVCARALLSYFERGAHDMAETVIASIDDAPDKALTGANLSFLVKTRDGMLDVLEDASIARDWTRYLTTNATDVGTCPVTATTGACCRIWPRVMFREAQWSRSKSRMATGASLVSFNVEAAERNGHDKHLQGMNAPVSLLVAQDATAALQFIADDTAHHVVFDDRFALWWAETDDEAASILFCDTLIANRADRKQEEVAVNGDARFHLVCGRLNATRIAITAHVETSTKEALLRARRFLARTRDDTMESPMRLARALAAIERPGIENTGTIGPAILLAILEDEPCPAIWRDAVIRAVTKNRRITCTLAQSARAILAWDKTDMPTSLDTERDSIPYLLGRAFCLHTTVEWCHDRKRRHLNHKYVTEMLEHTREETKRQARRRDILKRQRTAPYLEAIARRATCEIDAIMERIGDNVPACLEGRDALEFIVAHHHQVTCDTRRQDASRTREEKS